MKHGKILIIEFNENEDLIYQQIMELISSNFSHKSVHYRNMDTEIIMNPYTRTVIDKKGCSIYLTAKQFDLLYFLYLHKGQVFTKEQIYEHVWGYDDVTDGKNLTSFIRKLRTKIEPDPDKPQYIITVWGVGYKFNEEKP